ncbi:hypothetical protein [Lacticaseibacillus manihotivorans]|jgi:hypothetical protein|nr:hypothetical protein [Lacticaseibacillus manihotivorans]
MKYSGLLKITMPSALTYCAAGALTLLVLEVLWPVVTGSHAQASFDWVTMIGIIGWVSGLYMSQGVIGIGFQTGASRKTMVLAHWTFWLIVSAGYSAVAMIGQTLLVNFGINSTTRMSGFPNYMVAGHGISTFIFLLLIGLMTCGIGSLFSVVMIFVPKKMLILTIAVGTMVLSLTVGIVGIIGIWSLKQLWPALMRQAWVWLISMGILTAALAVAGYVVYQHLNAPEQIGRR